MIQHLVIPPLQMSIFSITTYVSAHQHLHPLLRRVHYCHSVWNLQR